MKRVSLIISFIIIFGITLSACAFEYGYTSTGYKYVKHEHSESSYQHAWCSAHNGIEEFENKDFNMDEFDQKMNDIFNKEWTYDNIPIDVIINRIPKFIIKNSEYNNKSLILGKYMMSHLYPISLLKNLPIFSFVENVNINPKHF